MLGLSPTSHWELYLSSLTGGETPGAGQAGFPQHTQEADRLSAGPAGRGRGQEVCQVTLGEKKPRRCWFIYISSLTSRFIIWYVIIKYLRDSLSDTRMNFSFRSFLFGLCLCYSLCVNRRFFSVSMCWAKLWRLTHRLFVCFSRCRRSFLSQH